MKKLLGNLNLKKRNFKTTTISEYLISEGGMYNAAAPKRLKLFKKFFR